MTATRPEPTIGASFTRLGRALSGVVRAYFEVWSQREAVEGFYARGVQDGKALAFRAIISAKEQSPGLWTIAHLERLIRAAEAESKRIEEALAAGEYSR